MSQINKKRVANLRGGQGGFLRFKIGLGDMEIQDKIAEESWDKIHEKCWRTAISLVRENLCSRCPHNPCEAPCETAFHTSAYISLAAFMAKVEEN